MSRTVALLCLALPLIALAVCVNPSTAQDTPPPHSLLWKPLPSKTLYPAGHPQAADGDTEVKRRVLRTSVPGGWFVQLDEANGGVFFYPDPDHRWDGTSLR